MDDEIRYQGPFHSPLAVRAIRLLDQVGLFRRARKRIFDRMPDDAGDDERFLAIVARSAEIVRERWGAGFTVVYWDEDPGDSLPARLAERGLDVVRVSELLPRERWDAEIRLPIDRHPSPAGNLLIGETLARRSTSNGGGNVPTPGG